MTGFDKRGKISIGRGQRTITAGGWPQLPKGGEAMPITVTFHIFGYVVTIKVKSENRHPAR